MHLQADGERGRQGMAGRGARRVEVRGWPRLAVALCRRAGVNDRRPLLLSLVLLLQTHGAPEYVTRIARSMALARAVRPQDAPVRPDWK